MRPQTRVFKSGMTDEDLVKIEAAVAADVDFFQRTGHCGACARPAVTCSCTAAEKCGCWDLHHGNRNRPAEVETLALFDDPGAKRPRRWRGVTA